jgi:hypothetical protein
MVDMPHSVSRPREVVGIFPSFAALEAAIDELLLAGFDRCELSLLARQDSGVNGESAVQLADDPYCKRTDYYCSEALGDAQGSMIGGFALVPALATAAGAAASGTGILTTLGFVAATGGTGALIGAALAYLIAQRWYADHERQISKGGLLLWVGIRSPGQEEAALDILRRHAAHHVHSHDQP